MPFQKYFGDLNPLLTIATIAVAGIVALVFLEARGWFAIYRKRHFFRGLAWSAMLATLFAIAVVLVDVRFGYPKDLNVPPPDALLFYPVMGFVAEFTFHVIPLALLLLLLGLLFRNRDASAYVWPCILLVAAVEPVFQMGFAAKPLSAAGLYTGIHVFAISLAQLVLFRRFDFVAAMMLRLTYYLYWHILWGCLRLHLLF
jgi:hypothetical protein